MSQCIPSGLPWRNQKRERNKAMPKSAKFFGTVIFSWWRPNPSTASTDPYYRPLHQIHILLLSTSDNNFDCKTSRHMNRTAHRPFRDPDVILVPHSTFEYKNGFQLRTRKRA